MSKLTKVGPSPTTARAFSMTPFRPSSGMSSSVITVMPWSSAHMRSAMSYITRMPIMT